MQNVSYGRFLRLAIPFILCTVTQPLLGAVDTGVVGRLGNSSFIGGVAIGTVIFNTLYWLFGFLRVATSGFAAQSLGENRHQDQVHSWLRPLIIGSVTGLLLILCQQLIIKYALLIYDAEPDVAVHATIYFRLLIWGAPLVLVGYANLGWLMGRGHVREVMILQVGANSLNIFLDITFVKVLHMGVAGVATATLIAQGAGFLLGIFIIFRRLPSSIIRAHLRGVFEVGAMKKLAVVNGNLFIRTVCLLTMTNIFVARGSQMGTDILAANAILFQIQYLLAYLFDGLANAVSVFAGKFVSTRDRFNFSRIRTISHVSLGILALILATGLLLFNKQLLNIFTDIGPVLKSCHAYLYYLILYLPAMDPGLVYEGFYVGATYSGPIRNSLVLALVVFIPAEFMLILKFDNHGLWMSFILFCAIRSCVLFFYWPRLDEETFVPAACGVK